MAFFERFRYCNGHALKGDLGDCSTGPATNLFCILVACLEEFLQTPVYFELGCGHLRGFATLPCFLHELSLQLERFQQMTETLQQMSEALASLKGSLVSVAWQMLSCKTRAEGRRM